MTTGGSRPVRVLIALGLVLYSWLMLGLDLLVHRSSGQSGVGAQALGQFRRQVLGTALLGLGAATALAGIVVAILAIRRNPRLAATTLLVAAAWVAVAALLWTSARI